MAISEETRHQLYLRLEAVLGPEEATTLMEHLPPVGWADVVTNQELDSTRIALARDIEALRSDMNQEFARVRTDMNHELALVRGEMHALRLELVGEMHAQTTRLVLWLVPMIVTALGVAVGVARLP